MNRISHQLYQTFDSVAHTLGTSSMETWAVLAAVLLLTGYFLLKGNPVRGT